MLIECIDSVGYKRVCHERVCCRVYAEHVAGNSPLLSQHVQPTSDDWTNDILETTLANRPSQTGELLVLTPPGCCCSHG